MTRTKKNLFTVAIGVALAVIALAVVFVLPSAAETSGTCGDGAVWTLDDRRLNAW